MTTALVALTTLAAISAILTRRTLWAGGPLLAFAGSLRCCVVVILRIEGGIVAAGAAVANAIRDATGVRATRLPVAPSQLHAAMA